jgi:hypothetical protein
MNPSTWFATRARQQLFCQEFNKLRAKLGPFRSFTLLMERINQCGKATQRKLFPEGAAAGSVNTWY